VVPRKTFDEKPVIKGLIKAPRNYCKSLAIGLNINSSYVVIIMRPLIIGRKDF
jgi:hypothetical protein